MLVSPSNHQWIPSTRALTSSVIAKIDIHRQLRRPRRRHRSTRAPRRPRRAGGAGRGGRCRDGQALGPGWCGYSRRWTYPHTTLFRQGVTIGKCQHFRQWRKRGVSRHFESAVMASRCGRRPCRWGWPWCRSSKKSESFTITPQRFHSQ